MSRAGVRSPPAASRPLGSPRAWTAAGNQVGSSASLNQTMLLMFVRHVLLYFRSIILDRRHLALDILADRLPEPRIGNPMRRVGVSRLEAATDLVLALRAGLEALEPMADSVSAAPAI